MWTFPKNSKNLTYFFLWQALIFIWCIGNVLCRGKCKEVKISNEHLTRRRICLWLSSVCFRGRRRFVFLASTIIGGVQASLFKFLLQIQPMDFEGQKFLTITTKSCITRPLSWTNISAPIEMLLVTFSLRRKMFGACKKMLPHAKWNATIYIDNGLCQPASLVNHCVVRQTMA